MFRSLESIRADSHQQQHTHPTLTSNMSSSNERSFRPRFPSFLLPSLPFSRRRSGRAQTPAIMPLNFERAPVPRLMTSSTITKTEQVYQTQGEMGSIMSPLSMSPNSKTIPLPSRTITGEISADPPLRGSGSFTSSTNPRRIGFAGPFSSEPPQTPPNNDSFPFPSSSTQTSPTSIFSRSSPTSSLGTSPPSTLSGNIARLLEPADETYPELGSAALLGSPHHLNPNAANVPLPLDALDRHKLAKLIPSQLSAFYGLARQSPTLRCAGCSTDIAFASQIISKGFTGRHGRAYLLSPMPPKSKAIGAGAGIGAENCATTNSPQVPQSSRFNLLDPFGSFSSSQSSTTEEDGNPHTSSKYNLLNITTHAPSRRQLVTGLHVVADISCCVCGRVLGWKYVDASETSQRYKIGKFILETKRVVSHHGWEDREDRLDVLWNMGLDEVAPIDRSQDVFVSEMMPRKYEFTQDEWPVEANHALGNLKGKGKGKERLVPEHPRDRAVAKQKGYDSDGEVEFNSDDDEELEEIFAGTWDRDVAKGRRDRKQELERRKKAA